MKESHIIEFKEAWRDEYLKWICGFANAEGGTLVLGRNDQGQAVGVKDAEKLLRDLPNKIRDVLGIMADVRLKKCNGKELIEIRVGAYPSPVNYRGEYHYRSGSTKQELKGAALDRFLMRKYGRTWDSAPVPNVTTRNLSRPAVSLFKQLARDSRRMAPGLLREAAPVLIEKLKLIEGDYLTRAAVLLFHPEPDRFFFGAFMKSGYFKRISRKCTRYAIRSFPEHRPGKFGEKFGENRGIDSGKFTHNHTGNGVKPWPWNTGCGKATQAVKNQGNRSANRPRQRWPLGGERCLRN